MSNHDRKILVARVSAVLSHNGRRYVLARNRTTIHSDHPLAKQHSDSFRPLQVDISSDVPEPTPEPGPEKPKRRGRPKKTEPVVEKVGNDGSAVDKTKKEEKSEPVAEEPVVSEEEKTEEDSTQEDK